MNDELVKQVDKVFSIDELAEYWQVSRRVILEYIRNGKLKAFKIGRSLRVTQEYYEEFIEKNTKNK